ncbi:MAG: hypothetical protein WC337_11280 [Candidatus Muiribacteriota bacterium]
MRIFENKIRKLIFVRRNEKNLYFHTLRNLSQKVEVSGQEMDKIRIYNNIYHIFWAAFISGASNILELGGRNFTGMIYFAIYIFMFFTGLEVFYSLAVFKLLGDRKVNNKKIDINNLKKAASTNFLDLAMFGFIIVTGIYIFYYLKTLITFNNNFILIASQYLFFLIYYFLIYKLNKFFTRNSQ